MAKEPDNLVLVQLREIRITLAGYSTLLAAHSTLMKERFDQIDKRFGDFHALTSHTLMLGTTNSLKSQDIERRYGFSEGEQRRVRERIDDIESRLSELEDKIDR